MDECWLDFVNSDRNGYLGTGKNKDHLTDRKWVREYCREWGIPHIDLKDPLAISVIGNLRKILARMATAVIKKKPVPETDLRKLNKFLAEYGVTYRLQRDGKKFSIVHRPIAKGGYSGFALRVVSAFSHMLANGDLTRWKFCENEDCGWIFYDHTRSRTRRWCEGPGGCGNLINVRSFRSRASKPITKRRKKHSSVR